MTTPLSRVTAPPPLPKRRVFDLLVIVSIACGLLALAWRLARERGHVEESSLDSTLPGQTNTLPEPPELQPLLPLEKFGMVLTRQHVASGPEQALAALDQLCREVLASADEWVLSLAISPEEQQLLDSLQDTQPLPGPRDRSVSSAQLFPLTQPVGRAGIRGGAFPHSPLTPALSPPVEPPPQVEPFVGEGEHREPAPPGNSTGSSAATGRRLICWGFILSDGAEGYTVWFARPREKLPRSVSQEGHTP